MADPTSIGIALLLFGPVEPFQHILEGKSRHLLAQFRRGLVFGVEKVGVATSGLLPLAFIIIATSIGNRRHAGGGLPPVLANVEHLALGAPPLQKRLQLPRDERFAPAG